MPTADHIKALIRSYATGDDERFYAVAMQVAAQAARHGQIKFAQDLRDLVDQAKARWTDAPYGQQTRPVPIVQPRGELAGLLVAAFPKDRFSEMALDKPIRSRIDRILLEQRCRETIRAHNMSPLRKLLFQGPPGTGKTMTAAALAGELSLSLFTIQLDALITEYLGETAAKLGNYIRDCPRTRLGRNSRILSFGNSSEHTGIPPAFPLAGRLHSHTAVRCGLGIASGIAVHSRGWHGRGAERTARSNSVRAPAFRQPPQCRPASSTSADGRPCPGPCVASAPPCPRSGCCAARRTRRGSAAGAARSCDGRFRSSRA